MRPIPAQQDPPTLPVDVFNSLPRELRVRIMRTLVLVVAADTEEQANAYKSKGDQRWVGTPAGFRELVKVTRVSSSWCSVALDGQLWTTLSTDLFGPNAMPIDSLTRIARAVGPFMRHLNLRGLAQLSDPTLVAITQACASRSHFADQTSLVSINLAGLLCIYFQAEYSLMAFL